MDQINYIKSTGFLLACEEKNIETIRLLISKDSKIIDQKNKYGSTVFIIACRNNNK